MLLHDLMIVLGAQNSGIDISEYEMYHFITYEIITLIAVKFEVICVKMSGEL